ncbi:unnamed protein product, partial [Staurois parvus]
THLASHGAKTSVWSHSVAVEGQQQWEAIQQPMTKWKPSRSVRRPESGTWQSGEQWRRYKDPCHTVDPATAMRRRL